MASSHQPATGADIRDLLADAFEGAARALRHEVPGSPRDTGSSSKVPNEEAARPSSRLTLSIGEAAEMLGVSRALMYDLAARREVPVISLGRRKVIPVHGLERWLSEEGRAPGPERR